MIDGFFQSSTKVTQPPYTEDEGVRLPVFGLKNVILGTGAISTICALAQIGSYAFYLRISADVGALNYILVFTTLCWMNGIYLWHTMRLLYLLGNDLCSGRTVATSSVWWYTALLYLLCAILQTFWWFYTWDALPFILTAVTLPASFIFFVTTTRRLHKIRHFLDDAETRRRKSQRFSRLQDTERDGRPLSCLQDTERDGRPLSCLQDTERDSRPLSCLQDT